MKLILYKRKSTFNTTQTQTKIEDFNFFKTNYDIYFNLTYSLNNEENIKKWNKSYFIKSIFGKWKYNKNEFNEDKQIDISDIDFNINELSNNNNDLINDFKFEKQKFFVYSFE